MASPVETYNRASQKTATNLKTIAALPQIAALSRLTLPEIETLTDQIAQVVPAGNVPGLILSGLARLESRRVPLVEQQRHLDMLFRGVRDLLDKAVYGAMFAGPAAVIMGYQKLLQLAGKDVDAAFPDGTWQFYLEFALREDTARHANETIGFQRALAAHGIVMSDADILSAWIMAALNCLRAYDRLLENEWRERIYTYQLKQLLAPFPLPDDKAEAVRTAYAAWERQRPYVRGQDAGDEDYPAYRRRKFDVFIQALLEPFSKNARSTFLQAIAAAEQEDLPAYLHQMQILARLEPGPYQETRVSYRLEQASLGVIWKGQIVLFPVVDQTTQEPRDVHTVRGLVTALLNTPAPASGDPLDLLLAQTSRSAQATVRGKLAPACQSALAALGSVPILLNWDRRDVRQPLAAIRQGQRGIGDHALTLFFTEESTVFDQSHIFFDGAWGAALAEILTGEALSWAVYLSQIPPARPARSQPARLLLPATPEVIQAAERARLPAEADAESTGVRLNAVLNLRRLLKMRNDLVNLTVNDLLILYRAIHGQRYAPSPALRDRIETLRRESRPASQSSYRAVVEAIDRVQTNNPAILIPMDASQTSPRERLYPTTFRNPMADLLSWHEATLSALYDYKAASGDRQEAYSLFDERQRQYLRMIAAFGELMRKYKDIALSGQSVSTASIKMLAHMPDAVQRLLDQIPGRFDVLNEIIKGEEVFSNVGRVAKGSTLRRFITAKDDNQQKTLAWGVVTDDQDVMFISLRDFRPHVTVLHENGLADLATLITQDYLDSYVDGFNSFVRELREITTASRETRLKKGALGEDIDV